MRVLPKKTSKLTSLIINHIKENLKAYIIISFILLIGIILGIIFINHMTDSQSQEVKNYLTNFINSLKSGSTIDNGQLLKKSIGNNLFLVLFMWFVGSTVIGIPIVIGMVAFRGFCLGYTISASVAVFGTGKGILFFVTSMLLQNLIFLPCMMALAVSGIKLYKSIVKNKTKENVKIEILRHTIFSIIMLIILITASVVEIFMSTNLLKMLIKYF